MAVVADVDRAAAGRVAPRAAITSWESAPAGHVSKQNLTDEMAMSAAPMHWVLEEWRVVLSYQRSAIRMRARAV